jgi:hypothetical protein
MKEQGPWQAFSDIFRETEARLRDARLKRITEDSEHGAKSSLDGRAWARR